MSVITNFSTTLQELNDKKAVLLIPTIVYVAILMCLGLIGNIMVFAYYWRTARRSSTSLFIFVLAIFDFMACTISMPGEILDIRYYVMFENVFMCKLFKFVNHLTAGGSSLTLVIIAIDRYKRVCSPLRQQIQVKHALLACVVAVSLALLFSWPSLIFYAPTDVIIPILHEINHTVTGKDCSTTTKDENFSMYITIFNGIYLLIFLCFAVSVIVLYTKIGIVVFKHNRHGAVVTTGIAAGSQSSLDNTATTGVANDTTELHKMEGEININKITSTCVEKMPSERIRKRSYTVARKHAHFVMPKERLDSKTIKCTVIMVTVTTAFIISCLPYLTLVIWRTVKESHITNFLSDTELILFEIGIRSYLLNNAINPILYSVFNNKFRRFIYTSVCPCLRT